MWQWFKPIRTLKFSKCSKYINKLNDHQKVFVCWKIENIFTSLSKNKRPQWIQDHNLHRAFWQQTLPKLRTLNFFNINYFCFINGKSFRFNSISDTFNDRTLIFLFVFVNFEGLCKSSLKEQLQNPLQHLF